jgi:CheY-like chemotaxis protein
MDILRELTQHVSELRCFACGICGSPEIGDEHVSRVLKEIEAGVEDINNALSPKVSLYKFFLGSLPSFGISQKDDSIAPSEMRNIDLLTPTARRSFLLQMVEGFSLQEIASILSLSIRETEKLVAQANQEIASLIATDVLIIEDEPVVAMDLEFITNDLGHEVIGVARTHREAVALAKRKQPGLILSDIQLADGSSGIAAVDEILEGLEAPVVFMTGSNLRPPKAEKPKASFFLRKPYKEEAVRVLINQALLFEGKAPLPVLGLAAR